MKTILFLLILTLNNSFADIIGGKIADAKKYPFAVSILASGVSNLAGSFGCGGSIIHERFVLTAAHCVDGALPQNIIVNIPDGSGKKVSSLNNMVNAANIYIHPNYKTKVTKGISELSFKELKKAALCGCMDGMEKEVIVIANDIALIELEEDLVFNDNLNKIKMFSVEPKAYSNGIALGWGRNSNKNLNTSQKLKEGSLRVLPPMSDKQFWSKKDNINKYGDSMLGLGLIKESTFKDYKNAIVLDSSKGTTVCKGDSGGPYVIETNGEYKLAGVIASVRYENQRCIGGMSAAASTSRHYDWIKSIVRDL